MGEVIKIYNISEVMEVLELDEERIFRRNEEKSMYIKNAVHKRYKKAVCWCDKKDQRASNYTVVINEETRVMEFIDVTPIQLSEDEKVILRNIPSEYKWIARDECEGLYLYKEEPNKFYSNKWDSADECIILEIYEHLFQQIQWSDKEPTLIADLLEG